MDPETEEIFFEIHSGLPREGPGNFESTKRAFNSITNLPYIPKILDIGCGPGQQTLDLTNITNAEIIAVDNHQPFLNSLNEKMVSHDLQYRVKAVKGNMFNLAFGENSFDIIWSEGAIYIMGFENGLKNWKRFLKEKGYIALTEVRWLKPEPPGELKRFWREGYPNMRSVEKNLEIIERNGFSLVDHFTLPESAWLDNYYHYLHIRIADLKQKYQNKPKTL